MTGYFIIAGVTVTVLGIIAIGFISWAAIHVIVLGQALTLRWAKDKKK